MDIKDTKSSQEIPYAIQNKNSSEGGGFRLLNSLQNFLLNLFFPKFCLGCQKEGAYLCQDCKSLLDIAEYNYCLCDTKPSRLPLDQKSGKCSRCQDKKLSGLYFALSYKEKALTRKLIYQFKYKPYLKDLAETLAAILIEHFVVSGKNTNKIWENSILVPVPLDKKKLKMRGYNQAEELSRELSKILEIPVISNNLVKVKHTKPQMELKKEEREKNLENAFIINPARKTEKSSLIKFLKRITGKQYSNESSSEISEISTDGLSNGVKNPSAFEGKKLFLVDDVYTTGSTMQECAKTLKESGIKQVWGITIARED